MSYSNIFAIEMGDNDVTTKTISTKQPPTKELVHKILKQIMGQEKYSEVISHSLTLKRGAPSGAEGNFDPPKPTKRICLPAVTKFPKVKDMYVTWNGHQFKFVTKLFPGEAKLQLPKALRLDLANNVDMDKMSPIFNATLEEMGCKLYAKLVDKETGAYVGPNTPCVCALCGPHFSFVRRNFWGLRGHLEEVHMDSLQKEFTILGKCPRCSIPRTEIKQFAVHAVSCYSVASNIVDNYSGDESKKAAQLLQLEEQLQRKVVYNHNPSTPTEYAMNEISRFTERWPNALQMEVIGNKVPLDGNGTHCDVKLHDLRYCLDSAKGDVLDLARKLVPCVIAASNERPTKHIFAFKSMCITGYILKHFGEDKKLIERRIHKFVEQAFRNAIYDQIVE